MPCFSCHRSSEGTVEEDFESVVGKNNVIVVDQLQASFKWFPKVCIFFFKKTRKGNCSPNCVMPNAEDDSVLSVLREHLLTSLKDICLNISENFEALPPKYCILFKNGWRRRRKYNTQG